MGNQHLGLICTNGGISTRITINDIVTAIRDTCLHLISLGINIDKQDIDTELSFYVNLHSQVSSMAIAPINWMEFAI